MIAKIAFMKIPAVLTLTLALCLLTSRSRADETKHYLYMSTPDGAQGEGRSGEGILVFDIDKDHSFVKRIDLPAFKEGIRGFTGSAVTKCVYYSTTAGTLGCFNLETEKVVWQKTYNAGCDRSCITTDGKVIYAPTGWWHKGDDSGLLMVNADNGEIIKRITVGKGAHNSIASLDGKFVYLGTETRLTQFDAKSGSVLQKIEPVGESGVFPYTVDSRNKFAYVCLGKHVGFDVVNLTDGSIPHRVYAEFEGQRIQHRTHGAGMTPDETQLWISDQDGKKLFTFDLTKTPPAPTGHLDLSMGGHGWVCFSLDGKYGYSHTPDIFEVKTRQKVATFKDENSTPFGTSKFIEVHILDGKVVNIGNEFGLGRKN
jgi:outer membrane protein assembly factor BamB